VFYFTLFLRQLIVPYDMSALQLNKEVVQVTSKRGIAAEDHSYHLGITLEQIIPASLFGNIGLCSFGRILLVERRH